HRQAGQMPRCSTPFRGGGSQRSAAELGLQARPDPFLSLDGDSGGSDRGPGSGRPPFQMRILALMPGTPTSQVRHEKAALGQSTLTPYAIERKREGVTLAIHFAPNTPVESLDPALPRIVACASGSAFGTLCCLLS